MTDAHASPQLPHGAKAVAKLADFYPNGVPSEAVQDEMIEALNAKHERAVERAVADICGLSMHVRDRRHMGFFPKADELFQRVNHHHNEIARARGVEALALAKEAGIAREVTAADAAEFRRSTYDRLVEICKNQGLLFPTFEDWQAQTRTAVDRFRKGEKPSEILSSMNMQQGNT